MNLEIILEDTNYCKGCLLFGLADYTGANESTCVLGYKMKWIYEGTKPTFPRPEKCIKENGK